MDTRRYLVVTVLIVFGIFFCRINGAWAGSTNQQSGSTAASTQASTHPSQNGHQFNSACLSEPIQTEFSPAGAEEKAEALGKGTLGSLLDSASGGLIGFGGKKETKLARRPRYPKSEIEVTDAKLSLELQGAPEDNMVRMAVRVEEDPEKGAPHLIVLQDRNCRVLLPLQVKVFELWGTWKLHISWTQSYYQDGQLTGTESGGWDTSWTELMDRYHTTAGIPGIWQNFGGKPFGGIRGVIAEFQLPEGETFVPGNWFLISHIARPGPVADTVITEAVVTSLTESKKESFSFEQARNVSWNVPVAASKTASIMPLIGAGASAQGLLSKNDCKKIFDEINRLECAADDCEKERQALAEAEQALTDAQQAYQDAENAETGARNDITRIQRALDNARTDQSKADEKLAITEAQQGRLVDSLKKGGHGLSAGQVANAVNKSKETVAKARDNAARKKATVEQAEKDLAAANAALVAANAALAAAREDQDNKQQAVDAARQALRDCLERERRRCDEVKELWRQYDECRHRYREQEKTESAIDQARGDVEYERDKQTKEEEDDYKTKVEELKDQERAVKGLGGTPPSSVAEASAEAEEARKRAGQHTRDAEKKLKEAETKYQQGDLDGAKQAAEDAKMAQGNATAAMEEANDLMDEAIDDMDSEYRKALLAKQKEDERKRAAAREAAKEATREAALKKEACLRHIAEYFQDESHKDSLLESLGGFVSGDAKNAISDADSLAGNPEKLKEFLGKLEEKRQLLENLLSILNGIADNNSLEARNEAFSSALNIAQQISQRIPGLGEFFNFYATAFDEAVKALNALGEKIVSIYKPMVDDYLERKDTLRCCSYNYQQLNKMTMEEVVNKGWEEFKDKNLKTMEPGLRGNEDKLEEYFKTRLKIQWIQCCLNYTLSGK